jgi:NAD-dependent deacetylase
MDFYDLVSSACAPVVISGAGMSVSCGLPTYRGEDGLWTKHPEAEARSTPPPAKLSDPAKRREWWDNVWGMWGVLRSEVDVIDPSPAHQAIAKWEARVPALRVVTQNVDGLHQRAGSLQVHELHGSIWRTKCSKRRCTQVPWADYTPRATAPSCPHCGRPGRPDVVLFTEPLDEMTWEQSAYACEHADLIVVVGTSGAVWPANTLPNLGSVRGARLVRIDPGPWLGGPVSWAAEIADSADSVFGDSRFPEALDLIGAPAQKQ